MNRTQRDVYVQAQKLSDVVWNAKTLEEAVSIVKEVQAELFEIVQGEE